MSQLNFDASQVAPMAPLEAVPTGWYQAYMSASESKPNSAGTGSYLNAEFTILAPAEFAGKKLFDKMNLVNPNPVAVEIAYKTLSAICHAVQVIQVQDSAQLHNRPLMVKAVLRPAGPGADGKMYDASNEVRGYKALDTVSAPMAPPPAAPAHTAWAPPTTPMAPVAAVAPMAWNLPPAPSAPVGSPPWAAVPAAPAPPAPVAASATPVAPTPTPPWAQPPQA